MMISGKRGHGRRNIMSTIEYFAEPVTAYETFDGDIVNASESGLCILTTHLLNKGQKIEIKSNGEADSQADSKGNVVPIYSYGLKFTNDTKEQINSFIASIEENRREADKQRGINLQADEFIDLSVQFKEALEIFAH